MLGETIGSAYRITELETGDSYKAFDPWQEKLNGLEPEAEQVQIETFLTEYLTKLQKSEYYYQLSEGKLTASGWSGPIDKSFAKAIDVAGLSTDDRLQRLAEYESFQQIQYVLATHPINTICVLRSPNRGWGYSYISTYEKQTELDIRVQVHRVWEERPNNASHIIAARNWDQKYGAQPIAISPQLEQIVFKPYWQPGLSYLRSLNDLSDLGILRQALVIDNAPLLSSHEIISAYYDETYNPVTIDQSSERILRKVSEFSPVSKRFALDIADINNKSSLNEKFKIFLIRAKVFFDEETAEVLWGKEMVTRIKDLSLWPDNKLDKSLGKDLLAMRLVLTGSCNGLTLAASSLAQVEAILDLGKHSAWSLFDPDKRMYVCTNCGKIQDIDTESGKYITNCSSCKASAICNSQIELI